MKRSFAGWESHFQMSHPLNADPEISFLCSLLSLDWWDSEQSEEKVSVLWQETLPTRPAARQPASCWSERAHPQAGAVCLHNPGIRGREGGLRIHLLTCWLVGEEGLTVHTLAGWLGRIEEGATHLSWWEKEGTGQVAQGGEGDDNEPGGVIGSGHSYPGQGLLEFYLSGEALKSQLLQLSLSGTSPHQNLQSISLVSFGWPTNPITSLFLFLPSLYSIIYIIIDIFYPFSLAWHLISHWQSRTKNLPMFPWLNLQTAKAPASGLIDFVFSFFSGLIFYAPR